MKYNEKTHGIYNKRLFSPDLQQADAEGGSGKTFIQIKVVSNHIVVDVII